MQEVKTVKTKTLGISPKLPFAVIAAVLSYLLTQQIVDLPAVVDLVINAFSVGVAVFVASPGTVVATRPEDPTN